MKQRVAKSVVVLAALTTVCFPSQSHSQGTSAPLHLFTSGKGNVTPLQVGQLLVVGQTYYLAAVPDADYVFSSGQGVTVFTFTQMTFDASGNPLPPITSIVPSLGPNYSYQPFLEFTM